MRWTTFGLLLAAPGCLPLQYDPPPQPARELPDLPMPNDAPAAGSGRVVIDVVGEQAKVAKVAKVVQFSPKTYLVRNDELLCVSPCVLDLPQGAHELSFTSTRDPTRTSTADVVVSTEPSAVRHALGVEKPASLGYAGGFLLTLLGGTLVTFGGIATTAGLVVNGQPTNDQATHVSEPGASNNAPPTTLITVSLIMIGVGLLTTAGGIALMTNNRPEHQPGATTYWAIKE